jgi:hypothetical protein
LALAISSQEARAQMCIPLTPNPIQFSSVSSSKARNMVPIETVDKWVLSDQSVHYLSTDGYRATGSLPGQPLSHAVIGDTFWIGTTSGIVRYRVDEPNLGLDFLDASSQSPQGRESAQHLAIDQISTAFDVVLLSGLNNVYRYSAAESTKEAYRTGLPPGRAYGNDPYWWVTKSDVYLLPKGLSLGGSILHEETADEPIVAGGYLWLTTKKGALFAISETGAWQAVGKIPGAVTTTAILQTDDDQKLPTDVWVATDQGLWRVPLDRSDKGLVTLSAPYEELKSGGIRKLLVLQDRLFYSVCSQRDPCQPSVWEALVEKGHLDRAQVHKVASSAGDFWLLNSAGDTLYIPTQDKLIGYSLSNRQSTIPYDHSTRFVETWGTQLLMGSALQTQKPVTSTPALAGVNNDTSVSMVSDRFANLCRLVPDAELSVKFEGAELLDWYAAPFGIRVLVGNTLRVLPTVHQISKPTLVFEKGALQVCAPCAKEDDWKDSITSAGSAASVASNTFDFSIRDRMSQDKKEFNDVRVIVISQSAFWSALGVVLFVAASAVLVFYAGKDDSGAGELARKILFRVLPDSQWVAWINLPVQIVTSFEVGLWWFVRPVLIRISSNPVESTPADSEVVTAISRESDDETALVIYECPQDEEFERASSLCKIVASDSVTNNRSWKLPVPVRLEEMPDSDIKKALLQRLQPFSLDNATLADRLLRSRRIVLVFLGSARLGDKIAAPAIMQSARGQISRSVIITLGAPTWGLSSVSKNIKSLKVIESQKAQGDSRHDQA